MGLPSAQWHLKGAASSPASCQVSFFKAAEADQMLKIPQVLSVHIDFAFSCYVSAPPHTPPHPTTGHPIHPLTLLPFALRSQLCPFKCHVIPLNMYFVVVLLLAVHFFLVTQLRPKTNWLTDGMIADYVTHSMQRGKFSTNNLANESTNSEVCLF